MAKVKKYVIVATSKFPNKGDEKEKIDNEIEEAKEAFMADRTDENRDKFVQAHRNKATLLTNQNKPKIANIFKPD